MECLAAFVLKHKKAILILAAVLVALSVAATVLVVFLGKINSDMLTYLPAEMDIAKGKEFLSKHFKIEGDAMLAVQGGADYQAGSKLDQAVKEIKDLTIRKSVNGKTETVAAVSQLVWVGEATKFDGIPGFSELADTAELAAYLRAEAPREEWADGSEPRYNYIFLGMLNASASSPEAFDTLNRMREIFRSHGFAVATEGMTHTADVVMNDTLSEIPTYLALGLAAVLIILLLTTESFADPLILLATLGISILVAMGTNLIFPSVSIISFAVSSILQLAVTMDYAIVFMHIFKQKRAVAKSAEDAVKSALPNAWSSILASCLTTVGGFAALFFMRFEIGADLGKVLIKAVVLSMISVVILQPVLTVMCTKWIDRTRHKALNLSFERTSRVVMRIGKPLVFITLLLLLPAFILQNLVDYSYFKMFDEPENPKSYQKLSSELRNQLIIAVPFEVNDTTAAEGKTPIDFVGALKENEKIKSVISIFSVIKPEKLTPARIRLIRANDLGKSFFADVGTGDDSVLYTLYTVILNGDVEDAASLAAFESITATAERYFGQHYYTMGMLTGVHDMARVTPTDFTLVSLVSAAIIFLVLLLVLKNFRQSVLLILTIEIAIFLNLAVSVLMGVSLNFMVYILISSVQLGCTVDYAILMATRYKDAYVETAGDRYESARIAFQNSASAIFVSASIIISVTLVVLSITGNVIIKQMMELIARGGAISLVLVMTSLPTFLSCTRPTMSKKEKRAYYRNFCDRIPERPDCGASVLRRARSEDRSEVGSEGAELSDTTHRAAQSFGKVLADRPVEDGYTAREAAADHTNKSGSE